MRGATQILAQTRKGKKRLPTKILGKARKRLTQHIFSKKRPHQGGGPGGDGKRPHFPPFFIEPFPKPHSSQFMLYCVLWN